MLLCPICKINLRKENKSYKCENNHCFDIARQGYLNLLPVQNKHSINPGDTREMLIARREFLNNNNYVPICSAVKKLSENLISKNSVIADIGCGEGYYLNELYKTLTPKTTIGIDISKDAVKMACSYNKKINWIVATASCLPVKNESVDLITAMFSLFMEDEFYRILKKDGYIIEVRVANEHLIELKEIIYETVFKQDKKPCQVSNKFETVSLEKHSYKLNLDNKNLCNLLKMTPHFWRIKETKKLLLESKDHLTVTVAFWVRVLKKI